MFISNGVPNDVLYNFNSLSIILVAPVLNYGLYPLLRKYHIRFGPVARIMFGLFLSAVGGIGYTVLNYYAYKLGPCGDHGSSASCVDAEGVHWLLPSRYGGLRFLSRCNPPLLLSPTPSSPTYWLRSEICSRFSLCSLCLPIIQH